MESGMAIFATAAAFFIFSAFSDVHCLQWTAPLQDSSVVPACVNRNVSFPWSFLLDGEEKVQDISWLYQSQGREPELMAVYRSGDFLPTEAFSQRVHFLHLSNAGLVLDNVTMADSGPYSVEVDVHGSSKTFAKHEMVVYLEVADFFQVSQAPEATYDNTTDSWHVQLKCGLFSSLHQPAGVTWMTPSGVMKDSTSYKDGYLYLQLPNPVEGGNYTCRLPPSSSNPTNACLPDEAPLSKQQPTFTVDEVKVRLTLLEAENRQMKALLVQNGGLASDNVAFHAYLSSNTHFSGQWHVIMDQVVTNEGNAYNPSTGEFIAPYSGLYFFAATSSTDQETYDMEMRVGDRTVCWTASKFVNTQETGACQVTVRLEKGQNVWLRHYGSLGMYSGQIFYALLTSFTGYLIRPMPQI